MHSARNFIPLDYASDAKAKEAGLAPKPREDEVDFGVPDKPQHVDAAEARDEVDPCDPSDHNRLARLARRMAHGPTKFWPDRDGRARQDDNECVPAGYTYLAQMLTHDLVSNIAPLPTPEHPESEALRDFRSKRLVLDTLYGGGPATHPSIFAIHAPTKLQRIYLRQGRVSKRDEPRPARTKNADDMLPVGQPMRDIPRTACPFLNDAETKGFADALIADPRNDDNLILSQLTALFHELHNLVIDQTLSPARSERADLSELEAYRQFLRARSVVALVYRNIIVKDLLRRLLDRCVYNRFTADLSKPPTLSIFANHFSDHKTSAQVPVEFSHAVFRFAHAMVRHSYVLNDDLKTDVNISELLSRTSSRSPHLMPLACDWLVAWNRFFDLGDGITPNPSRRIRPDVGGGTLAMETSFFPNEHGVRVGGLYFQDLLRGDAAGVASVDALIKRLPQEKVGYSNLLACANFRQNRIADWFDSLSGRPHPCRDDVQHFAENPPLYFFTLFEAAHDKSGKRLGRLGSTIVAEVVFHALYQARANIEGDPDITTLADKIFEGSVPKTMPQLIKKIMKMKGLQPIKCPEPLRNGQTNS